jgi:Fe-S-cluster containining protein
MTNPFWKDGIRFQCQSSGNCCTSHGEYGFVYMTVEDRERMAKVLGMTAAAFTKKHCMKTGGVYALKEDPKNPDCMFLKNKRCSVYEGRPTQCRTWPFWPEVMNAKAWKKEIASFCPGVDKGPIIPAEKIEIAMAEQKRSESLLDTEASQ